MATTQPPSIPQTSSSSFFLKETWNIVNIFLNDTVKKFFPEIAHLSPIILIFGAAIYSLFTLNKSLAFLAASGVEAHLFSRLFKQLGGYFVTPTSGVIDGPLSSDCSSTFQTTTFSRFKMLLEDGLRKQFPNQSLYFLSFVAAYCYQGMKAFSREISELGPSYSSRPYIALYITIPILLAVYSLYLLLKGCDSLVTIFFSILLGGIIGVFISGQNTILFGKESVNVLFVPSLVERKGMDFVCVATKG